MKKVGMIIRKIVTAYPDRTYEKMLLPRFKKSSCFTRYSLGMRIKFRNVAAPIQISKIPSIRNGRFIRLIKIDKIELPNTIPVRNTDSIVPKAYVPDPRKKTNSLVHSISSERAQKPETA